MLGWDALVLLAALLDGLRLPRAEHDERLDGVVTEESAMHFPRGSVRLGGKTGRVS